MTTGMSGGDVPPTGGFPRNARDFLRAIEELFRNGHTFYVLERDDSDSTYLITWADGAGSWRKSWVTQGAMDQLTSRLVMN